MKNLIKFELRKILTKRFSLISIAVILLFSFILAFSSFQGMHAFDGKSTEGGGKSAVAIDKAIAAKYEGILTDEKVQKIMTEFKPTYDLQGMNAKYLYLVNSAPAATPARTFSHTCTDIQPRCHGISATPSRSGATVVRGAVTPLQPVNQALSQRAMIFLDCS